MRNNIHTQAIYQLDDLLNQLDSEQYAQPLAVLNGSSIGQHSRHIIEFFQCLLEGSLMGIVDYDARQRNLMLEENIGYAQNVILEIIQNIDSEKFHNLPISLAVDYAEEDILIPTNFMRELVYLVEHSIHHYALIRIGVQENFREITLPLNFGVAYSTVKYKETKFA
jgi:hypothetical protein